MLDSWATRPGNPIDSALTALARGLVRLQVSPNLLSVAALASGVAGGVLMAIDRGWWALVALLVSGTLDAVDGRVARMGRGATAWGGVLDLTFDRVVEAAVLLGLALPRPWLHVPALVLAATWYVNLCAFLAVGAASNRQSAKVIDYPPGLLERGEALVFAFLVVAFPSLAAAVAYLYAALGVVTGAQRLRHGYRALGRGGTAD